MGELTEAGARKLAQRIANAAIKKGVKNAIPFVGAADTANCSVKCF